MGGFLWFPEMGLPEIIENWLQIIYSDLKPMGLGIPNLGNLLQVYLWKQLMAKLPLPHHWGDCAGQCNHPILLIPRRESDPVASGSGMLASTISFQTRLISFNRYWLSFTAFNIFKNLSETRPKYAGRACGGTPCAKGSVGMEIRQKSSVWWGGFRTVCWTLVTIESLLILYIYILLDHWEIPHANMAAQHGIFHQHFAKLLLKVGQASTNWLQLWLQISHGQVELREIFFLGVSMIMMIFLGGQCLRSFQGLQYEVNHAFRNKIKVAKLHCSKIRTKRCHWRKQQPLVPWEVMASVYSFCQC